LRARETLQSARNFLILSRRVAGVHNLHSAIRGQEIKKTGTQGGNAGNQVPISGISGGSLPKEQSTPMRHSLAIAAALALFSTGAVAQSQNPPAANGPQNSVINRSDSSNRQATAPVAGRNSFTEGEAKSRIEKMGFSNVSNLSKDDQGVWRGRAMKDGKTVDVSLDYQGNVIQAPLQGSGAPGNAARGAPSR
jgi:hypothetical protein